MSQTLSILTAIFPREPGLASFIGAKDDGSGGDNWSCKMCKAPVKSSPPTTNTQHNQHESYVTVEDIFTIVVYAGWQLLKAKQFQLLVYC